MSKYHKGDKFIVEIKEVMESSNGRLYRSDFKTLTFDDNGLDKLQKYEEVQIPYSEAYNKGLEDAWELAKKVVLDVSEGGMPERDMISMFGEKWTVSDILKNYTPQEAFSKLEAYEKEQTEIKVGDVVERMNFKELFVVSSFNEEIYTLINANGKCVCANVNQIKKTGKHIDLTDLFKQIGGTE